MPGGDGQSLPALKAAGQLISPLSSSLSRSPQGGYGGRLATLPGGGLMWPLGTQRHEKLLSRMQVDSLGQALPLAHGASAQSCGLQPPRPPH